MAPAASRTKRAAAAAAVMVVDVAVADVVVAVDAVDVVVAVDVAAEAAVAAVAAAAGAFFGAAAVTEAAAHRGAAAVIVESMQFLAHWQKKEGAVGGSTNHPADCLRHGPFATCPHRGSATRKHTYPIYPCFDAPCATRAWSSQKLPAGRS
jgi:hypothetical protein